MYENENSKDSLSHMNERAPRLIGWAMTLRFSIPVGKGRWTVKMSGLSGNIPRLNHGNELSLYVYGYDSQRPTATYPSR